MEAPVMFDLASVQNHKSWERNGQLPTVGNNDQHCLVCNRPMKDEDNTWAHMSVMGELFPADYDNWEDPDSQGCFPVGNSCKKKIPAAYLLKNL